MIGWTAVVSVYQDEQVMEDNLVRSPSLSCAREVVFQRDFDSVAGAYNAALREAAEDVVLFVHPDVYLPETWITAFRRTLLWLNDHDPNWGVLGLFGSTRSGEHRGFVFSTGLGRFVGAPFDVPLPVRTVDEFAFVVRRGSGLTFDERLPGAQSQLCATDLCLQAEQRGLGVYVIPCFSIHNSNGWSYLPREFWRPYLYMRRKWRSVLPVYVPYTCLTVWCTPMVRNSLRAILRRQGKGHRTRSRVKDVVGMFERLRSDVTEAIGGPPESGDSAGASLGRANSRAEV